MSKQAQARYRNTEKGREYEKAYRKTPMAKYHKHKYHAKQRGIEWAMTFDEWWSLWEPYWMNMGQSPDSLHMCRKGDEGPYSKENCFIGTARQNGIDGINKRYGLCGEGE